MPKRSISDTLEETLIAVILGLMTIITFANVVVRYGHDFISKLGYDGPGNILWALEATVFLFAWLVIIGASYAIKKNLHLGVDIAVNLLPEPLRRIVTLIAVGCCLVFACLVLYGAFTYWLPFFGERAWYEVDDIPMPDFLQFLAASMNEGERWEKLPRFFPYFCLPLGFSLILFRFMQSFWRVWTRQQKLIIASHEADS